MYVWKTLGEKGKYKKKEEDICKVSNLRHLLLKKNTEHKAEEK